MYGAEISPNLFYGSYYEFIIIFLRKFNTRMIQFLS